MLSKTALKDGDGDAFYYQVYSHFWSDCLCPFMKGIHLHLLRLITIELSANGPKQKEQKVSRQGKQEFERTFVTEANTWVGKLNSGQTITITLNR